MDPSVCRLHPGVAVTGFCPACLRDRLAGLQPPSSADLRRCKSFSYARYAAKSHQLEPQRRSCDLFRQEPPGSTAMEVVPDQQEEEERRMEMEPSRKSSSFGSLLGKKLQQWRRKKKEPTSFRGEQQLVGMDSSRRSCDQGSASAPWESAGPMFDRLAPAATMLSMEEEDSIPRSDGQIPVEEEDFYCDSTSAVPGSCAQTRDYYLDSSSSGRRRRSSTTSGRNSFSDVSNELTTRMTANARVSPAIAHHQSSGLVHHHQHHHQYRSRDCWDQPGPGPTNFSGRRDDDDLSGSLFRANKEANKPNKKKGVKGWSIWGLIHKKSSSRKLPETEVHRSSFSSSGAGVQVAEYPWPELRARGYNGQMLRCNSSISARRSISGTGMETQHHVNGHGSGRMRMDEVLLERTMSTRSSSYSRSGHDHPMGAANYQFNHHGAGVRSSKSKPSKLPKGNIVLSGPGRQAGP
jgi:hypothetical protein